MRYNFCTYFDSNYLFKALAMYRSLCRQTMDFKLWVLCFDDKVYEMLSLMALENVELIALSDFEDDDLLKVKAARSKVEYCWTCTPSLPLYILKKHPDLEIATYIDADLYFYSNPKVIFAEFGDSSIMLIEHRYPDKVEYMVNRFGRFCVQFMAFRNDNNGIDALEWWRERCLEWCRYEPEDGKFGDQKYLDDWESRFKGVCVIQNKGAGLAPWNIYGHHLSTDGGRIKVDDDELVFYHFQYLMIYRGRIIQLGHIRLAREHKRLLYEPYIREIFDAVGYVKALDSSFSAGIMPLRFKSIKDIFWAGRGLIRGNFTMSG